MAWTPVLRGDIARRARVVVDQIFLELTRDDLPDSDARTLAGGSAGRAMFMTYYYLASGEPRARDRAIEEVIRALDWTSRESTVPAFLSGFPGVLWAAAHISERIDLPVRLDDLLSIDDQLVRFVRRDTEWIDIDLLKGVVGLGIYASDRPAGRVAQKLVREIVANLQRAARRDSHGCFWFTPAPTNPTRPVTANESLVTCGVAHGITGAIAILATDFAMNPSQTESAALARDATRWLLSCRTSSPRGSSIPHSLRYDRDRERARVAWCHGDVGIAGVLAMCASLVQESAFTDTAIDLAMLLGEPTLDAGPTDAGLCHGAAGLAHIANRIYQRSDNRRLRDCSIRWYQEILRYQQPTGGVAGYRAWMPKLPLGKNEWHWVSYSGLLDGAAGIGLVLLASISSIAPAWDSALLLSSRYEADSVGSGAQAGLDIAGNARNTAQ